MIPRKLATRLKQYACFGMYVFCGVKITPQNYGGFVFILLTMLFLLLLLQFVVLLVAYAILLVFCVVTCFLSTSVDLGISVIAVFLLLGKVPKGSRMKSGLMGPQLCSPVLLDRRTMYGKRLANVKRVTIKDTSEVNKALRYHFMYLNDALPYKGTNNHVTEQMSTLHWSEYPMDMVYLQLLEEIAQDIAKLYKFNVYPDGSYETSLRISTAMALKDPTFVVLSWQNQEVKYNQPGVVEAQPDCILPAKAFQVLLGVLLSDGCLHKAGKGSLAGNATRNPYFEITMTANPELSGLGQDVTIFIAALLEMLGLGYGMVHKMVRWYHPDSISALNGGMSGLYYQFQVISSRSVEWRILETYLYQGIVEDKRIKEVTSNTLAMVDSLGWAMMYVCDGSLEKGATSMLHFQAFGLDGCKLVADMLTEALCKFNKAMVGKATVRNNAHGITVAIPVQTAKVFMSMVLPFCSYSAYYKFSPAVLQRHLETYKVANAHLSPIVQGPTRISGKLAMGRINSALIGQKT